MKHLVVVVRVCGLLAGSIQDGTMRRSLALMTALAGLFVSVNAYAADLGANAGYCLRLTRSSLLDTGNIETIRGQIDQWYEHALQVSEQQNIISSARPTFIWASEAKIACGKAQGYLKSGEIEEETVSKCDCFHGRMAYYLN